MPFRTPKLWQHPWAHTRGTYTLAQKALSNALSKLGLGEWEKSFDDLGSAYAEARAQDGQRLVRTKQPLEPTVLDETPISRRDFLLRGVTAPRERRLGQASELERRLHRVDPGASPYERAWELSEEDPDYEKTISFLFKNGEDGLEEAQQIWEAKNARFEPVAKRTWATIDSLRKPGPLESWIKRVDEERRAAISGLEDGLFDAGAKLGDFNEIVEMPATDHLEDAAQRALKQALARLQQPIDRAERIATTTTDVLAPAKTLTTREFFRTLRSPLDAARQALTPEQKKALLLGALGGSSAWNLQES